jgi:hypothetical protein
MYLFLFGLCHFRWLVLLKIYVASLIFAQIYFNSVKRRYWTFSILYRTKDNKWKGSSLSTIFYCSNERLPKWVGFVKVLAQHFLPFKNQRPSKVRTRLSDAKKEKFSDRSDTWPSRKLTSQQKSFRLFFASPFILTWDKSRKTKRNKITKRKDSRTEKFQRERMNLA